MTGTGKVPNRRPGVILGLSRPGSGLGVPRFSERWKPGVDELSQRWQCSGVGVGGWDTTVNKAAGQDHKDGEGKGV